MDFIVQKNLHWLLDDARFKKYKVEFPGDPQYSCTNLTDSLPEWEYVNGYTVGGLLSIGYGEDGDLLLVTSIEGRGVFDCLTGKKVARDYEIDEPTYEQGLRLIAPGIGPLAGQMIRMSGIHGGGLCSVTKDGWHIRTIALDWNLTYVAIQRPYVYQNTEPDLFVLATGEEIRACGFSFTGRSFVVALGSHTLEIFKRATEQA